MSLLTNLAARISGGLGRDSALVRALRPLYEALLDASSGFRGVAWPVNGEPVRIDPRVRWLIPHEGERELFDWLKGETRPGDVVLDIGSFLGVYAVLLARWAGPEGKVIAFEPTPAMARTMRRHVALNGMAGRIALQEVALGAAEGEVELHLHHEPYRNAVGATDPAGQGTGRARVRMTTVDAVCAALQAQPTLVRMDVQGLEAEVLRGMKDTIARAGAGFRMVVEVHPQLWAQHGVTPASFDALLEELGLRAAPLEPGAERYAPDAHVILRRG